jgi:hypothetical protein
MKKVAISRIKLALGIMAVSFLTPVMDICAQNSWITLPDGRRVSVDKNAPVFCSYTTEDGKLKSLQMKDPREVVKVIVMLKDRPLAQYKKKMHYRRHL